MPNQSTTAVIVTFNPPAGFADRLRSIAAEVDRLVVIDNASAPAARAEIETAARPFGGKVTCVFNNTNEGLAAALNRGISLAIKGGAEWVLLLDHDSTPQTGMVRRMFNAYSAYSAPVQIALIAPEIVDRNVIFPTRYLVLRNKYFFKRFLLTRPYTDDVATVITSGSLVKADIFQKLGLMPEAFFIDYIDHAFCLRLKKRGLKILLVKDAILHHSLGAKTVHRFLGMSIITSHHNATRCFYIFRNRLWLWRLCGRDFPAFVCHDFLAAGFSIFRIIVFEDNRREKLLAVLRGIWSGFHNIPQHPL